MDQSEGRILYHVTSFTAQVILEVWDRVLGTSPARPNMKTRQPEVTSSKKPEINDRPRDWIKKHTFIQEIWFERHFQDQGSREGMVEPLWCKDNPRRNTIETRSA